MSHYADGQEVKIGDVAHGTGYNCPYPVTGVVTAIRAGDACNLDVAYAAPVTDDYSVDVLAVSRYDYATGLSGRILIGVARTAGATKDFNLVHRPIQAVPAQGGE